MRRRDLLNKVNRKPLKGFDDPLNRIRPDPMIEKYKLSGKIDPIKALKTEVPPEIPGPFEEPLSNHLCEPLAEKYREMPLYDPIEAIRFNDLAPKMPLAPDDHFNKLLPDLILNNHPPPPLKDLIMPAGPKEILSKRRTRFMDPLK